MLMPQQRFICVQIFPTASRRRISCTASSLDFKKWIYRRNKKEEKCVRHNKYQVNNWREITMRCEPYENPAVCYIIYRFVTPVNTQHHTLLGTFFKIFFSARQLLSSEGLLLQFRQKKPSLPTKTVHSTHTHTERNRDVQGVGKIKAQHITLFFHRAALFSAYLRLWSLIRTSQFCPHPHARRNRHHQQSRREAAHVHDHGAAGGGGGGEHMTSGTIPR